jgi:hypothetical protein
MEDIPHSKFEKAFPNLRQMPLSVVLSGELMKSKKKQTSIF